MLLNKERAYAVMDKYGLDGLVAREFKNVYYLSDFWGGLMKMRREFSTLALLPRREDAPAALCITGTELHRVPHVPTWMPNIIPCSYRIKPYMGDFDTDIEEPEAEDFLKWPARQGATYTPNEQTWMTLTADQAGRWAATTIWGLRRAIKDAGLERARLGTDDPRLVTWLQEIGLTDLTGVEATNVFREIRMVKTEDEIALMRTAAVANEQACDVAMDALGEGAVWDEIERVYMVEMARSGCQGLYITAGPGGLPAGHVQAGEPIMLDALGHYQQYHGDIGRTALVGEPSAQVIARNRAMTVGLETAYDMMRPGVRLSEVSGTSMQAIRKAGFPEFVFVAPHSLGLEHTDHPVPFGPELPGSKGDLMLEPNMVLNVDLPYHEFGWGSLHLEDTVRITQTGCEVLTSGRTELRVIPRAVGVR